MHRTEATNKEVDKFGTGKHGHRDRVVGPPLVPGTVVNADVVDNFEEIAKLLEFFGVTLLTAGTETYTQIRDLVVGLFRGTIADPSPPTRVLFFSAAAGTNDFSDAASALLNGGGANVCEAFGRVAWELSELLPEGAIVTRVRGLGRPGTAQTGGNRSGLDVTSSVYSFATPAVPSSTSLGSDTDDGTVTYQVLDSGVFSSTINKAAYTTLTAIMSADSGATNVDPCRIYGIEVTFTLPYFGKV